MACFLPQGALSFDASPEYEMLTLQKLNYNMVEHFVLHYPVYNLTH